VTRYHVERLLIKKLPGDQALRSTVPQETAKVQRLAARGYAIMHVSEVTSAQAGRFYEFWMQRPLGDDEEMPAEAANAGGDVVESFGEDFQAKVRAKQEAQIRKAKAEQDGMIKMVVAPEGAEDTLTISEAAKELGLDPAKFRNRITSRTLRQKDDWPFEKVESPQAPNGVYVGDAMAVVDWAAEHFGDMMDG